MDKKFDRLLLLGMSLALVACGKDAVKSASTPLADSVSLIQKGVLQAGSGMSTSSLMSAFTAKQENANFLIPATTALTSSLCDVHGSPLMPSTEGGGNMPNSDSRYPGVSSYCAMTVNDGDTVIGGFTLAKSLICSLEMGGIEFLGVTQTLTLDFSNTTCWPNGSPGGGGGSAAITAVGTAPASFNAHYTKGVSFSVPAMGLNFKIAANIDGDKIEFIALEDWSGSAASESLGNTGVMAGEITKSTGVLRFEKRDERVRSTCTTNNCGWNRHTRILANLRMSGGEPTGVNSLDYVGSNAWVTPAALASGSDTSSNGRIITARGTISSQVKARLFEASGKTTTQMKTVGQWSETANTSCISSAGISNSNCSSETGISLFTTDTKFSLFSTPAQTSPSAWLAAFTGFNFSTVNLNTDNAF